MTRFKPVRAGILNLWDYHQQEFRFADGHLVLRGPNGSGKTKALEVLMPFVLDGSLDARRLDPFSGQERTMRSNLLYGGEKARHGYVWLEFARGDEHVTVGVGLRAQAQSREVKRWYFVADAVVGDTMHLLTAERVPVTRRELMEQLGDATVTTERAHHRAAVDRRLFGLGEERFAAMLDLVLTLRRPQLAKDLDPERLSQVLSDGLRTLDRDLLQTSAVAFDNLEAAQRELTELERASTVVADLLTHWRTYLRARARKRIASVREMAARVHTTERQIEERQLHIQRSIREASTARGQATSARSDRDAHGATITALQARGAYKNRGQLEDARLRVDDARRSHQQTTRALDRAAEALRGARDRHDRACATHGEAEQRVAVARATLATHAGAAGIDLPERTEELHALLIARRSSVEAVLGLVGHHSTAALRLRDHAARLQTADAALESATLRLQRARKDLADRHAEADPALRSWHGALPSPLDDLDLGPLLAELPGFGDTADLPTAVRNAWSALRDGTLSARDQADGEAASLRAAITALDDQIAAIEEQRQDAPPTPTTRPADRTARPGAPLWRLVRFREDLVEADQAGLEGALLASGLLDAWVDPGETPPPTGDTHLVPSRIAASPTLADLLLPEDDAAVSAERIDAILRSVSLQDADVVVTTDGRFLLGPLAGSYRPDRARYIGATARARHRADRIEALEHARAAHHDAKGAAEARALSASATLESMVDAVGRLPDPSAARRAWREVHKAESADETTRRAREEAVEHHNRAQREASEAARAVERAAAEHGVPATHDALHTLRAALDATATALRERAAAEEAGSAAARRRAEAASLLDDTTSQHRHAEQDHDGTAAHLAAGEARLAALSSTLGAEVQEILARIAEEEKVRDEAQQRLDDALQAGHDADAQKQKFQGQQDILRQTLPSQQEDLSHAEARLAPFQRLTIQATLGVPGHDAPLAERLAAVVEAASFTDEQLKATETRLTNRLAGLDHGLGTRFHSVTTLDDGLLLVEVADELGQHGLSLFSDRLSQRLTIARHLMADHEQKLFEDHLLGTLCGQLRARIQEATDLVQSMDQAMRGRRLASGKSVGIHWRPLADADPTRKELLGLLRYDPEFLTADRLARVRALLSTEVQSARREHPDRSYLQILEGAVDYRRWYRFELSLIDATGATTALTRRAHSRLSGGEKAATVHLPLFAAAHAQFGAGAPHSPRLVALDEAFAGIDETGVPELLRLAHAFDLDWFLTGHDLWVTEPFLPGVMHYDLAHDPVGRTVSAWPILWTGTETIEGDGVFA